ncbi:hypothetical protein GCM10027034_19630 [Ramlibacter solisilvae]|nr:DUF2474 family protein [Ramlibacter tataouinensis]
MGEPPPRSWWRRLAWLALLWLAGVAGLAVVAGLLKLLMRAAGMSA